MEMNRTMTPLFFKHLLLSLLFVLSIAAGGAAAQEEAPGKLIETFTLSSDAPSRVFFDGKLRVELISATAADLMKTIIIRVSSRALKAEYRKEWQEHTYLEMLRNYIGSPISGSPFKCAEGWLYYEKSEAGSVTLSLRANPHMSDSFSYHLNLFILENWIKAAIFLCWIAVAFFLYYYTPLFWSFVSIQHLAHAHARQTGFPSSPVLVYLLKRLPLLIAFYLMFILFFDYGWKGAAATVAIAVALQLYFNWYNVRQLNLYAALRHFTPIAGSKNRAFKGRAGGLPAALAVGGTFIGNPYYDGSYDSGGSSFHMSFLIIEIMLNNARWDGLILTRDINKPKNWSMNKPVEDSLRVQNALAGISKLSKYSILQLEVRGEKLVTAKMFAPDTPAEINLLVDLVADVARAIERSHP